MSSPFQRFRNKRALVMGLGLMGGGVESVRFLHRHGAKVLATDMRDAKTLAPSVEALRDIPVEYRLGEHREEDFKNAEVVIHSPAVRPDHKLLELARANGAEVTQEMSLFIEACPALTVGITGSNGKTTTTAMCYEMLCEYGMRAQPELEGKWADPVPANQLRSKDVKIWLGGNIGTPLINRLDEISKDDIVVLELSSFQLMDWHRINRSCDIAVITNITPNHLDWHKDFAEYKWAKTAIWSYLRPKVTIDGNPFSSYSTQIFNWDDVESRSLKLTPGTSLKFSIDLPPPPTDGSEWRMGATGQGDVLSLCTMIVGTDQKPKLTLINATRADLRLPGVFNWSNALGAATAANVAWVRPRQLSPVPFQIAPALRRFRGVEHRLEPCGEIRGAKIYNDSIATDPTATLAALTVFDSSIHLILGGASDKGAGYDKLAQRIVAHGGIKSLYLQGPTAGAIKHALERAIETHVGTRGSVSAKMPPMQQFPTFESACKAAIKAARQGDVVLMSPASTSFYEHAPGEKFGNFEERGKFFKDIVKQVSAESGERRAE